MAKETPQISQHLTHADYTVGWICALPKTELVAAAAMLDEEHPILPAAQPQDTNVYTLGRIHDYNVVIACLPVDTTGKVSAATVAKDMLRSFPAVRFGLMVGIGGGAPRYNDADGSDSEEEPDSNEGDIRLGDVVISSHRNGAEAVVQYDFGKSVQGKEFVHTGGRLNKPPIIVRNAVGRLEAEHIRKGSRIPALLEEALKKYLYMAGAFQYPETAKDRLFKPGVIHTEGKMSCKPCCGPENTNLVRRQGRPTTAPSIYYRTIGSADQVMKDAVLRDKWAKKEGIICFEMEAAGLMDSYPCLVIRSICDYVDSHKNKAWQPYAAITAASYVKELLLLMPGQDMANLHPIKEKQFRDKVLAWISMLDYNTKQTDIFAQHTDGTGTWMFSTSSFATWTNSLGKTLYCPGIPGAGKTVLSSLVIDYLRQSLYDSNAALAFIYCMYNDRRKADDLLACLLKQIISQISTLPNEVRRLYGLYQSQNKTNPCRDNLIKTLQSITSKFARVYVVIDALDECQDNDRTDLIDALNQIKTLVNIFVTARPWASIRESLCWDLEEPIKAIDDNIATYTQAQIRNQRFILSSELLKKPELHRKIVSQLVANAAGMFLHAQFHVKYLAPKHNIRDLRQALENLPKTSEQIYERAIERTLNQDEETVSLATKTLQCVIGAVRLLHTRELQHALAVREGDYAIGEEALTIPNHLLSICGGLLTIDEESDVIRLVHHTAQEYFNQNKDKHFPRHQRELVSICLNYLSLGVFDKGYCSTRKQYESRTNTHVFLEYAATNLGKHASGGIKDAVLQSAVKLFSNRRKVSSATQAAFMRYQPYYLNSWDLVRSFYEIHYASYLGVADVITPLLKTFCRDIDLRDSRGRTPLSWAANQGHKGVVELLCKSGKVNMDSRDAFGRTPLSWAVGMGHEAVVKLLLDTGKVEIDSRDVFGRTPLSLAANQGQESVVKLLLDTGKVDINSRDRGGWTPLSLAANQGQVAVVQLLLDTGKVDIESKDAKGRVPLSRAERNGHEAVSLLLKDRLCQT